jgi:hypothetical protein
LYISPFFDNNVFSVETLWIYTTIGTLHSDTLKTSFRRVKQYRGISYVQATPPHPVITFSIAYERPMSSRFGNKYYYPPAIRNNFQNFGDLILTYTSI